MTTGSRRTMDGLARFRYNPPSCRNPPHPLTHLDQLSELIIVHLGRMEITSSTNMIAPRERQWS